MLSIIIPCYNEERHIGLCLDSILANSYEDMEIIVVDGMSNDRTRSVVQQYLENYPFIRLLDNPHRIKSRALNAGITAARGQIIMCMDAHAVYDVGYISKCIHYLEAYSADNVGGLCRIVPRSTTLIARAIAHSLSSPFAAGNATHRIGAGSIKWVDTVFGGCFRRTTFDTVGSFNEALTRGQDREFNFRLRAAGGKILFAPDIVCDYFARDNLKEFIGWIYVGGLTPFYISRITGQSILSWRNLIPLCFVLTLAGTLALGFLHPLFLLSFAFVTLIYLVAAFVSSLSIVAKERELRFLAAMLFIFVVTHVVYGVGSLIGLLKPVRQRSIGNKT